MNSHKNTIYLLAASILALALIGSVSTVGSAVYATGGLDDEEEEEAIEELQNAVEEIQGTLGTIELNLTQGANDIQANCPSTEEIVQEVVENITEGQEQNETEVPTCPFAPVQNNVTEPEPEPEQPTCQIAPVVIPEPNVTEPTCPFAPVVEQEQNITEQIEEVIQNVTEDDQPICNIPPGIIPELNITEPVVEQNVTEPQEQEVPICPFTGEPLVPAVEQNVTEPAEIQDEQEIATIEFEASCGCFVVDKSPEEVQ